MPPSKKSPPKPKTKAKTPAPKLATPITAMKHSDTRVNIPTEELRDFVADEEKKPRTILYPRDPSLDPQLVWKGKDEQDSKDLEVPAVPIYIQEKIQPQAIIENVRAEASKEDDSQVSLFGDFNGIKWEDLVDFYHHEQHWSNRMILGDSLMVMNSLAEKEGLKGKVQMIYLDPPYGIKFGSNWQVSTRKRDVKDGKAEDTTRQPEQVKAFRDTWQLGIHSYLAYLRDRLTVARELLTESGSIFVQISDENVHLVRSILDEVFGSENFCGLIPFVTTSSQTSDLLAATCDFLLWYSKSRNEIKFHQLYSEKIVGETGGTKYKSIALDTGEKISLQEASRQFGDELPATAKIFRPSPLVSQSGGVNSRFPVMYEGESFVPRSGYWKTNQVGFSRLLYSNRLIQEGNSLAYIRYLNDFVAYPINSLWSDTWGVQSRSDPKTYVVQTDTKVIERCMLMTTDPGDLILDPTCGSGTTAYVAEQWGRRWITCDTSRVSIALARTRLMAARYSYYLLADSSDGAKKESESSGQMMVGSGQHSGDIKRGFVYKRVPHVTLKSIANNEEIDGIHAKYQEQLEPIRAQLNKLLKQNWEEWEVPRQLAVDSGQSAEAKELHEGWWELKRARQKEIDASIARRADTELLYDQPYEDNKRIRVTGPFTVESLSPHRVLATDDERPATESAAQSEAAVNFTQMIIDNLKTAGVQNTVKKERLKFDRLDSYAGTWLQASGEYSEAGKSKRVAVSIGPEHGTVGPDQVKEAAKEAVQGVGFDLLIVCGFAFDPHVSEEAKRYGTLNVITARMNPDLAMGDELLKKTGAANLFMVFGEPDVDVKKQKDGKLIVTLKGVDVYDPTTGQIRSNSTDDIACWFVDTNYNGESFFVRHAYFTGVDEPYERLKRSLRAEIDEAAWSALYSTKSLPFDPPKTGKIAIKVINHYGDEVMKVFGA